MDSLSSASDGPAGERTGGWSPAGERSDQPAAGTPARNMLELLDIEELDTNMYRAQNEDRFGWPSLFGGQVAAQALMAAALTVPEGRAPHSLHGYFLRPGSHDRPVLLQVARDRDGRSFSARHVVALQRGEVIFSMSASFHLGRPRAEFAAERPPPPLGPEEAEEGSILDRFQPMLRLKPLPRRAGGEAFPSRMWAKVATPLPDDPLVHACALVYLSDVGSGFAEAGVEGLPRGGPSLDHAVWFHRPLRLDDWVLLDMWPLKAIGGRGLYAGSIQGRNGDLGALLAQEVLLRDAPGSTGASS